jgi:CRISPR-associated endonuclease Csy4
MKHYLELTLLHDRLIASNRILEEVYGKIHSKLASIKAVDNQQPIGVSFPRYNINAGLGDKIRLFATDESTLVSLDIATLLGDLERYVHVSDVAQVPDKVSYGTYRRVQVQSNLERVARRKAKRAGISINDAMDHLSQFEETHTSLPFVYMSSKSTAQSFKLFVYCSPSDASNTGRFSSYGLSASSTVPMF